GPRIDARSRFGAHMVREGSQTRQRGSSPTPEEIREAAQGCIVTQACGITSGCIIRFGGITPLAWRPATPGTLAAGAIDGTRGRILCGPVFRGRQLAAP